MRGHHSWENWRDGGSGRSRRGLVWDWCGPMRNEEGPAVNSRCGVLWIAWFIVTCKEGDYS